MMGDIVGDMMGDMIRGAMRDIMREMADAKTSMEDRVGDIVGDTSGVITRHVTRHHTTCDQADCKRHDGHVTGNMMMPGVMITGACSTITAVNALPHDIVVSIQLLTHYPTKPTPCTNSTHP